MKDSGGRSGGSGRLPGGDSGEASFRSTGGRIINIHPSLIPSFCGTGYYGLKVHEAALERGVKVTGATVHFVDEGTDTGPILLQKAVEVKEGDTPEILQRRVMEEAGMGAAAEGHRHAGKSGNQIREQYGEVRL